MLKTVNTFNAGHMPKMPRAKAATKAHLKRLSELGAVGFGLYRDTMNGSFQPDVVILHAFGKDGSHVALQWNCTTAQHLDLLGLARAAVKADR